MMPIKIFIAGDVVPCDRTIPLFKEKQTETLFGSMLSVINEADLKIVNLEAPVIYGQPTPIKKSGPTLYTSKETVEVLKDAGFNVITLANNHFRDQGEQGVKNTVEEMCANGLHYVGGGRNIKEANRSLYYNVYNKRIAIINVCEHEFSIAGKDCGGSNPLDIINAYHAIVEAKAQSDFVLVIIHGGIEHYQLPTPRMKKTYRFFIDVGASAVINHHQHCFSGYEIYKNKPIFYGLGNFCFDRKGERNSIWNQGYAVMLVWEDSINFKIYPYVQCDQSPTVCKQTDDFYAENIESLNSIIADDNLLEQNLQTLATSKERAFLYNLSSLDNHYVGALYRRGYFKSLYSKKKLFTTKNLICCESHNEILKEILYEATNS